MKIGMLVDTYLPILGGAEVHVLELSRALRAQGYELEICTAVPSTPLPPSPKMGEGGESRPVSPTPPPIQGEGSGTPLSLSDRSPGHDLPGRGVGVRVEDEFRVLRLPALKGGGWRAVLGIPAALPRLVTFIREVDFVHCHYSFLMAALGTLLGRLLGKPTAVTLHGLGTLDSSVGRSFLFRLYRIISLKLAGTIIATSQEMRSVALRFAPEARITVIPNGVNSQTFAPAPEVKTGREMVILTMRRLAPKNGVQYLVEAAPEVIAALPEASFWVAGEGKLEARIRQRVAELGLEEHFRFIGIVPHARTAEVYRQADIVAFPSSAESTSLACLEAMCCEKAILASRLGAYKDMLGSAGERGVLVDLFGREASDYDAPLNLPPERIHALAQAIIALAQDAPKRRQLGQAARRYAAGRYDWSLIAAQTARLYQGGMA